MMKITHNVALNFHPIFIPLNHIFEAILDLGFWIADLLYRFALSIIEIKLTEQSDIHKYSIVNRQFQLSP
jgi:hypothetical protein